MLQRFQDLMKKGDDLFAARMPLLSLWQTMAENFDVMNAEFTRTRYMSEEFGSYLMSGRPAMCHRDLTNSLPAMLRPRDQQWFVNRTGVARIDESAIGRQFLDWMSEEQYKVMYGRNAKFIRATKEADGFYVGYGNAVIKCEAGETLADLLYRTFHLRDVVWVEDTRRDICQIHVKWPLQVHQVCSMWREEKTVSSKVTDRLKDDPFGIVNCRHIVVAADDYDMPRQKLKGRPFVSIYVDADNETMMSEKPVPTRQYVIPRWATIPSSQYAYSPAMVYGLPDGRMFQMIVQTILEAGQKFSDPPMVAVGEAINGGVNLQAGSVTFADADYDERLGEVLRPLSLKGEGLQFAAAREERLEKILDSQFFLNQIRMPTVTKEMTADETERVYQEFMRQALPLLEPIEAEYSGGLCDITFETMLALGGFGNPKDWPGIVRSGHEIKWEFESPLQAAKDKLKIGAFQAAVRVVVEGMQVDPTVAANLDVDKGTRAAVTAAGGADWLVDEKMVAKIKAQHAQQVAAASAANQVAHGADVATKVATAAKSAGDAAQSLQGAAGGQ